MESLVAADRDQNDFPFEAPGFDIGLDAPIIEVAPSPEQDGAWLDRLLVSPATGADSGWGSEAIRHRLGTVPLDAILASVARVGAATDRTAEMLLYREWIEANPGSLLAGIAWFNLGVTLARDGHTTNAITAYRNAVLLRPDLHAAAVNLGLLLEASGETDAALAAWERATQPDEARVTLGIQRGRLLERLGRFDEAERALHQVLLADAA
jgi:tetratricopeptide (TPR) repeat protein